MSERSVILGFPEQINQIKLLGKVNCTDNALRLAWSSSGFTMCADVSGDISVEFEFERDSNNNYTDDYAKIAVFVDQQNEPDNILRVKFGGRNRYTLVQGVSPGIHTVTVIKINEKVRGTVKVYSVGFNGCIKQPPTPSDLAIEFLGDSLTAGSDLFVHGESDTDFSEAQDSSKSFASVAARILKADTSIVARSGLRTSDWKWLLNIGHYINERVPDITVIGLGTNDQSQIEKELRTPDEQIQLVRTILQNVRSKYPDTKIVWVYGLMLTALEDTYDHLISKTVEEFAQTDCNTYYCRLPRNNGGNGSHSSPEGHSIAGKVLSDFINKTIIAR